MPHEPLRFAVIGCGHFGLHLADLVRTQIDTARIGALVEPDEERRQAALRQMGRDLPAFATIDELLDHAAKAFDAVILTSPNHLHRDQAIAAARAGKHIFCEKPMALTGEDCRRMVEAAQRHGVRLMVGHKRRLRPAWRHLLKLVQQGELGQVCAVNINGWHHHPDIPPWWLTRDEGGGLLHRAGVHDVDYLNALLGEPVWVQAIAAPPVRHEAQFAETLGVTVGYASGAVAGLQVSLWFGPTYFRDSFAVQVLGTQGSALLKTSRENGQLLTWQASAGNPRQQHFTDGYDLAYECELRSFIDWVRTNQTPVLSWREGWRCVQVMEAAYASAAHDGSRVPVPEIPAEMVRACDKAPGIVSSQE